MDREIDRLFAMYEKGSATRRELVMAIGALALGIPIGAAARSVPAGASSSPVPSSAVGTGAGPSTVPAQAPIPVTSLNHVTTFVSDIPRTVSFYEELFGMPVLSRQGTGTNMSAGPGIQFVGVYGAGTAAPRIDHVCLGVAGFDVDRITGILTERQITHRVRMRDGTVPEIYMNDPDGLSIQLQDPSYCGGSGPLGNVCS